MKDVKIGLPADEAVNDRDDYGAVCDGEDKGEMGRPGRIRTYVALMNFTDDDGSVYEGGEQYPKYGLDRSQERINYLLSSKNALGTPVVKIVEIDV